MVALLSRLWRDRSGISLTEGLIAFPVIFLAVCAFIEAGVAMYQFNQTAKAVQVGARLAAVSDPLISLAPIVSTYGTVAGSPVPNNNVAVTCSTDGTACDATRLERLVFGTVRSCNAGLETGVLGMCDVNPAITARNVRVTYQNTGLGYVGRPFSPVVSVRVELRNLRFNFFLLGALLGLDNVIQIPPQAVTMTSEDLSTPPLGIASGSP